jgi:multiple sugar transport system substrate-binding protein
MTVELKFLAWSRTRESLAAIKAALTEFSSRHAGAQVSVTAPDPQDMWSEIRKAAIYAQGADLAEVGSTQIASLVGMDSLRQFSAAETASFDGQQAFANSAWQAGFLSNEHGVWGIPWTTDSRVIFYRRDLLAQAGIDPQTAFQTVAQIEQTLQALQAGKAAIPFATATASPQVLPSFSASWIWEAGGDFIHPGGHEVAFNSPEAQLGLRNYFNLKKYFAPAARNLDTSATERLFCAGEVAVTYAGTWLVNAINGIGVDAVRENFGVVLPPGIPFVGGTHLVVFKNTHQTDLALDLLHFLSSAETLTKYPQLIVLPARLKIVDSELLGDSAAHQVLNGALRRGRSFPAIPLWGLIEERFGNMLAQIWNQLDAQPEANLEQVIADSVNPLAERLNDMLASQA